MQKEKREEKMLQVRLFFMNSFHWYFLRLLRNLCVFCVRLFEFDLNLLITLRKPK